MEGERKNHSITLMCEVLKVSRSGFHKWTHSRDSKSSLRRLELLKHIERVFEGSRETYGVRRIHAQLRKEGIKASRRLIQELMHENGIRPKRKRRYKSTTDSKHSLRVSPNRLKRRFAVNVANSVWVSDITYIETAEGWLYLAAFIDLHSRRVVGWSMNERMTAELVVSAFQMAVERRGMKPRLVHSDRGSQYASSAFRKLLKKVKQSMSRKGDCWDNAVAESFFGALKSELVHRQSFKTRKDAELYIFEYIEIFYNKTRLHSALGYVSPVEFEEKGRKAA